MPWRINGGLIGIRCTKAVWAFESGSVFTVYLLPYRQLRNVHDIKHQPEKRFLPHRQLRNRVPVSGAGHQGFAA
jgi:hypothetical protein